MSFAVIDVVPSNFFWSERLGHQTNAGGQAHFSNQELTRLYQSPALADR
jgi:hypothetical protein